MTFTVSIAGASGYAGGELLRLVSAHPELELGPLAAGNRAGHPVAATHPHLVSLAGRSFVPTDADTLAEADLVLLALPHGESAALVAALPAGLPIVRPRCRLPARRRRRLGPLLRRHSARRRLAVRPARAAGAARRELADAARVANPGCYATAVALALAPLLAAGLVEPADVVVVAASGTSGAGRKASDVAARQRGDGLDVRVQGRRDPPAHPRDGAGALRRRGGAGHAARSPRRWRRCRAASWPPAPRAPVRASTEATLRDALARGVRRRAVRARPARRPDGRRPPPRSGRNSVHLQVAARPALGADRR